MLSKSLSSSQALGFLVSSCLLTTHRTWRERSQYFFTGEEEVWADSLPFPKSPAKHRMKGKWNKCPRPCSPPRSQYSERCCESQLTLACHPLMGRNQRHKQRQARRRAGSRGICPCLALCQNPRLHSKPPGEHFTARIRIVSSPAQCPTRTPNTPSREGFSPVRTEP